MAKFLGDVNHMVKDIDTEHDPRIARVAKRFLSFMKEGYEGEFFYYFIAKGWPKSETREMLDAWTSTLVVEDGHDICGSLHGMEIAFHDLVLKYWRMAIIWMESITAQQDQAVHEAEAEATRKTLANHIQKSQE